MVMPINTRRSSLRATPRDLARGTGRIVGHSIPGNSKHMIRSCHVLATDPIYTLALFLSEEVDQGIHKGFPDRRPRQGKVIGCVEDHKFGRRDFGG